MPTSNGPVSVRGNSSKTLKTTGTGKTKAPTDSAVRILRRRFANDPRMQRLVEEERLNADIAQLIYDARTAAGMTQQQLARLIGTKQPVIARLEDADYQGHSLKMLQRIARALNRSLRVELSEAAAR